MKYFLTVDYDERLQRHKSQVAAGENSDLIEKRFPGRRVFENMEIVLQNSLNKQNKVNAVFNTSEMSTHDITGYVVKDMLERL